VSFAGLFRFMRGMIFESRFGSALKGGFNT
jgi:hypothetical protein